MRQLLTVLVFAALAEGCVGGQTTDPPVVGIPNMYNQPRYDTQERQPFFADQRSMRPQVAGTVSREMQSMLPWATGRAADEGYILDVPPELIALHGGAQAVMARGHDRYDIYCAPCHSIAGDGKGMVSRRAEALGDAGLVAPSLHSDRLRHIPDGQIFATITNGVRNMPAYGFNIPNADRWAIVLYVRALQLSQAPAAAPEKTEQSK